MANQAERVWSVAGGTVKDALDRHNNYEFVITGHSLGAGTACLVHILCHSKRLVGRKMRCFAFASPPVFTPLQLIPNAVRGTTNYIHEKDVSITNNEQERLKIPSHTYHDETVFLYSIAFVERLSPFCQQIRFVVC